jgi:hypothetical protein
MRASTAQAKTNHGKRTSRLVALLLLAATIAYPFAASADEVPSWDAVEAVSIAQDAYIFGYPLVTFDMMRQQQTNVAAPDAEHAPMGQVIKMRSYPAVDNHCCAAPNADTLYTEVWLDVSTEPWVSMITAIDGAFVSLSDGLPGSASRLL